MKIWLAVTLLYVSIFLSLGTSVYKSRLKDTVTAIQGELALDLATSQELGAQKKLAMLKNIGFEDLKIVTDDNNFESNILNSTFALVVDGQVVGNIIDTPKISTIAGFIFGTSYFSIFFYGFYLVASLFVIAPLYEYKRTIQNFIKSCKKNELNIPEFSETDGVIKDILSIYRDKIDSEIKYNNLSHEIGKKNAIANLAKQVAHDIRSPLSVLNLLCKKISSLDSEKQEMLMAVSGRINDIANDLLLRSKDLNSTHEATLSVNENCVNVSDLIKQIVAEKQILYKENPSIKILTQIKVNNSAFAKITYHMLAAIISNLVTNSIESIRCKDGIITLSLEDYAANSICISVRDNGCGIEPEIIPKLGVTGFSYGKETSRSSGSGLGLNSAINIIKKFGGELLIASEVNRGTTIKIILPSGGVNGTQLDLVENVI